MKLLKIFYIFLSLTILIYILWAKWPKSIEDFTSVPDSVRSTLSGDTVQIPNIKAYFSNTYRNEAVNLYVENYQDLTKLPFPPIRINYPPEYAFTAIKDQTHSTYLEELYYPLGGSLFINGLEPLDEFKKTPRYSGADYFILDGKQKETKVTLRYYPTSRSGRLISWIAINLALLVTFFVSKKVFKK